MSNTLYYGEIVAKISAHLHLNPAHANRISYVMSREENQKDSIWTLCADAAKVFDSIEDLSGEHYINWHSALEHYANGILNHLLTGDKPDILDMVSITARSIETVL